MRTLGYTSYSCLHFAILLKAEMAEGVMEVGRWAWGSVRAREGLGIEQGWG
jgi:hypothetical protein